MSLQLRSSFRVSSLSHCRDYLRVVWADGKTSKFSNVWLRSAVRDPKYFDVSSLLYRQRDYASFLANDVPFVSVEHTSSEEDLTIHWENHSSQFNTSWLRANDHHINDKYIGGPEVVLWDAKSKFPVKYHYSQRKESLESWMTDLRRYGMVFFEGVPPSGEGMDDVMQQIGILKQRFHPTNKLPITYDPTLVKDVDMDIYNNDPHPVHTDTAYYTTPNRLSGLIATHYDAPVQDTENYFVDSLKVIEDIHREEPEAYDLLRTIPIRLSRRRMHVQEECDPADVHMYQYDHAEQLPLVRFSNKHAGFAIDIIKDHSLMEKYYQAFLLLESKLSDPLYHQSIVLKAGTLAIFNNNRVAHSRGAIHPSTRRSLLLGFMSEEMWQTRWRLINGQKSGLDEKWLYGCSNKTLQVLAKRKLMANEMSI